MAQEETQYDHSVEKLFKDARIKPYPKNQLIHYQGDPLANIYLIKQGYVKAYTILDSGDTRTFLILSAGDIFPLAFSSTLDWENYSIRYFYQSLTDTEMVSVTAEELKTKLESDKKAMGIYMNYLSASNEAIMNQLEVMKNKKAIEKVTMLLPYLVTKAGKEKKPGIYELQIKLSHQEVADLSGVTRETTTTLIKQLEKDGIIDQHNSKWIINMNKLDSANKNIFE